jgi:hypothetical protein
VVYTYRGERCPLSFWADFWKLTGWRSVRFYGFAIGRFYIGVQAFSKREVVERHGQAA